MKAATILFLAAVGASAQTADHSMHAGHAQSPYAPRAGQAIKALTDAQVKEYREGKGMGLAIPAELNGYPGPRHVLDMADALQLTAEQRARMQAVFDSMHARAVTLGEEIIALEQELDRAFAGKTITSERLAVLTRSIGERNGTLRAVHLEAHLAARAILTAEQIAKYGILRGYH